MSKEVMSGCDGLPTKVLIVEDSITFAGILKRSIQAKLDVQVDVYSDFASIEKVIAESKNEYYAALLDIVLPDAPNGEIVDLIVSNDIPSIVFTGEICDDLKDSMWSKRIVDYVPKENFDNIEHVVSLVDRLRKNIFKKVLIVDDSSTSRALCRDLLQVYNFQVLEAANGQAALDIMKNEDVHLIISDYFMPVMDGPAFVREVRKKFSKSKLPVIGFSSVGGASTSVDFLKSGANDFINKPYVAEEFYCRVSNTIDNAEYINMIKTISDNDELTGVFTRRSLFKYGEKLHAQQKRSKATLVSVMINIDNIKSCNETYGQLVGDDVIRQVAYMLRDRFRRGDVVSRYAGDIFCILCADMNLDQVKNVFEEIVDNIDRTTIVVGRHEIHVTISVGIYTEVNDSLEDMVAGAEHILQKAKQKGPGSVMCSDF